MKYNVIYAESRSKGAICCPLGNWKKKFCGYNDLRRLASTKPIQNLPLLDEESLMKLLSEIVQRRTYVRVRERS